MKKLIIPAFALALAAGAPSLVFAQDDHHDDKAKSHMQAGQGDGAKPDHPDTPKAPKAPKAPKEHSSMSTDKSSSHDEERERTRDLNRNGAHTNNPIENNWSAGSKQNDTDNRDRGDNNKHDDHDNNNNNHDRDNSHHDNDHNRNAGGVHVNINLGSYRKTVSASHHFRIGVYHAPAHYSYRRWGIGERLPSEYYVRDYWLTDFAAYDLVAPPDGYVWVRFGPDALLIDEDTGEVIQVVYGVFI